MKYVDITNLDDLIFEDNQSFNVFYASGREYLKYLSCSLTSLLMNFDIFKDHLPPPNLKALSVYIFHDGSFKTEEKNKFADFYMGKFPEFLKIYFISIKDYDFKQDEIKGRNISYQTFYKLFAFHKAFSKLKKCMYIDCDTIIASRDFFNNFLDQHQSLIDAKRKIAVVHDVGIIDSCTSSIPLSDFMFDQKIIDSFENRMAISLHCYINKSLGIPISAYFNAGFMIINHVTNNRDYFDELIATSTDMKFPFLDQCAMNKVIKNDKIFIPLNFNLMPAYDFSKLASNIFFKSNFKYSDTEIENARENPYLLHYAGFEKPWTKNWTLGSKALAFKMFKYNAIRTPYKRKIMKEILVAMVYIYVKKIIISIIRLFIKNYGKAC